MEKQKFTHESYGLLQISRFQGGDRTYFGSSIEHGHGISFELHEGELHRNLHSDWYHSGKKILEIRMTETQFAEAITHLNSNPVPVTIHSIGTRQMESPPMINRREQFEDEIDTRFKELEKKIATLSENTEKILSDKKNLSKEDRSTILRELSKIRQEIGVNMPFVRDCFREAMDGITLEAKAEAESFIRQRAKSLGINDADVLAIADSASIKTIPSDN